MNEWDFPASRSALVDHFERCAAWLNHMSPRSTRVDTTDPRALTLHVGRHGFFTFRETPDGPAYAWWYPASPRAVGDHHIVGDPVPVVRDAVTAYMQRAKSELG